MKRAGLQTWVFDMPVFIRSSGTTVGPVEAKGPLGSYFDKHFDSLHCGEKNWELAERKLMDEAIQICLNKAALASDEIDLFFAGDLLNQTVTSNYAAKKIKRPFMGLFGACSTSMEALILSAHFISSRSAKYVLSAVSSHNATAERQFRYPTEYSGQRPGTAQFTVTGSGAVLVSSQSEIIQVTSATAGKVVDWGITDANDMGSAMAPAAADTIRQHLLDMNRQPADYDMIITGDLANVGSPIVRQLLWETGFNITPNHFDCGVMIYNPDQAVNAGGSGCACSAVVTYSHILQLLREGTIKRVLVVATGALLSPTMIQQKESIPCIAHGVVLERTGGRLT